MRDSKVPGSLLDLLTQEENIMDKIANIQTDAAAVKRTMSGLSECETMIRNYCVERFNECARELDRLEQDLEQIRTRIGNYIRMYCIPEVDAND